MTTPPSAADDLIPLSALQHGAYCPRQCGLIHLEQAFDDNLPTLRGQAVHCQVDEPGMEIRHGLRVERALPVWSDALGLIGKADVVEFEPDGTPYPVEYKHGSRHKAADIAACDDLQLAAQALCLQEMTGRVVSEGALYCASSRRRRVVTLDAALLGRARSTRDRVVHMLASGRLPPPHHGRAPLQRLFAARPVPASGLGAAGIGGALRPMWPKQTTACKWMTQRSRWPWRAASWAASFATSAPWRTARYRRRGRPWVLSSVEPFGAARLA